MLHIGMWPPHLYLVCLASGTGSCEVMIIGMWFVFILGKKALCDSC